MVRTAQNKTMILFFCFTLWTATNMLMFRPLIPLYLSSMGLEALQVGIMLSSFSLVPAVISPWIPRAIASLSLRRFGVIVCIMALLGYLAFSFFASYIVLFLAQLLVGMSLIVMVLGSQSYVSRSGSSGSLAKNFSLLVGTYGTASVIGPAMGGALAEAFSYQSTFMIISASSACSFLLAMAFGRDRLLPYKPVSVTLEHVRDVMSVRKYQLSLVVTVAALSVLTLSMSFYPLYLNFIGFGPSAVGVFLSLRGLGESITPFAFRFLEAKMDRVRLLPSALMLTVGLVVLVTLVSGSVPLGILSLGLGVTFGLLTSMSLALATEDVEPDVRAMALSLRFSFNRLVDTIGPIAFGASALLWGYTAPFFVVALYLIGVIGLVRMRFSNSSPSRVKELKNS